MDSAAETSIWQKEPETTSAWRKKLGAWVESRTVQFWVIGVIILNAAVLGFETNEAFMAQHHALLVGIDKACLLVFVIEIALKLAAFRGRFFLNGWNVFDALVVGIALVPGVGPWAILRSLRVLRVLRLLTVVPSLRRVVAAFIHSIPGLGGVVAVMAIFFYTSGVLATGLFGKSFPDWFGSLGKSLYSLFQIMTLESWSMGIVRPVMEVYSWAWAFFVPFIMIATFTILNLFIGIIVSTMQELALAPEPVTKKEPAPDIQALVERMEADLKLLRQTLNKES